MLKIFAFKSHIDRTTPLRAFHAACPYAFLMVNLALLLKPSTATEESSCGKLSLAGSTQETFTQHKSIGH